MKPGAPPWRPLAALTVAVLALHGLALRAVPGSWRPAPASAAPVIQVRSVPASIDFSEPKVPAAGIQQPPIAPESIAKAKRAPVPRAPATPLPAAAAAPREPAAPPAPGPAPPAAHTAVAIPGSQRLRYQVQAQYRGLLVPGQGELRWRHDGGSYEARLEITAPMLPPRVQHSTGRITGEGLAPQRFSDRTRSEEAAHFDAAAGQVVFSTNRPQAALLPGAQDRLSVLLQLGALVAGDPGRFTAGTTLSMQTASTREAEVWTFVVEGDEELALAGASLRAVKLTRSPRKEFDQKVELWLAPGLDYAPARLRLTQPNGDWLDLQWSATDKG